MTTRIAEALALTLEQDLRPGLDLVDVLDRVGGVHSHEAACDAIGLTRRVSAQVREATQDRWVARRDAGLDEGVHREARLAGDVLVLVRAPGPVQLLALDEVVRAPIDGVLDLRLGRVLVGLRRVVGPRKGGSRRLGSHRLGSHRLGSHRLGLPGRRAGQGGRGEGDGECSRRRPSANREKSSSHVCQDSVLLRITRGSFRRPPRPAALHPPSRCSFSSPLCSHSLA